MAEVEKLIGAAGKEQTLAGPRIGFITGICALQFKRAIPKRIENKCFFKWIGLIYTNIIKKKGERIRFFTNKIKYLNVFFTASRIK